MIISNIFQGSESISNALIEAGANVNAVDNDGRSPLYWAIVAGIVISYKTSSIEISLVST